MHYILDLRNLKGGRGFFTNKSVQYRHGKPISKESLLYREIFEKHYPKREGVIKDFWMPNKDWEHCSVNDPSVRVLLNYGKSGL